MSANVADTTVNAPLRVRFRLHGRSRVEARHFAGPPWSTQLSSCRSFESKTTIEKLSALADLNKSQTRSSQCLAVLRFFSALTDPAEVSSSTATVASSGEEMETLLIVAVASLIRSHLNWCSMSGFVSLTVLSTSLTAAKRPKTAGQVEGPGAHLPRASGFGPQHSVVPAESGHAHPPAHAHGAFLERVLHQ